MAPLGRLDSPNSFELDNPCYAASFINLPGLQTRPAAAYPGPRVKAN
jgi:hypothetical protein